jgi:hypothetical protein
MTKRSTSSAPRPAPTPEKVKTPPPVQHQTVKHEQPEHTKGGFTNWGDRGNKRGGK